MSACPSEQQIVDFLDGKLGPAKGSEVHRHVDGCTACRALLAGLAPSINRSTLDERPAGSGSGEFAPPEPLHRTAAMTGAEPQHDVSMEAAARVASVLPLVNDDRYDVRDEFARGGLGRIFRAHDKRLARPVAVKQLLAGGSEAARRFIREALITARLQHPAIVPIYEAGRWPSGEPFYAMKLVSGRSLDQVIRGKKTLSERLTLLPNVIAVAEAIAYAHSQRIIHRDLKPANVLVGSFGETVLIDWGLAKDLSTGTEVGNDADDGALQRRRHRDRHGAGDAHVHAARAGRGQGGRRARRRLRAGRAALSRARRRAALLRLVVGGDAGARPVGAAGAAVDARAGRAARSRHHRRKGDGARSGGPLSDGARVRRRSGAASRAASSSAPTAIRRWRWCAAGSSAIAPRCRWACRC